MYFGSLFTGIGGMDLGLERAGMHCSWQVEYDTQTRKFLEKKWPEVKKYGDIRHYHRELFNVDVLIGGDPCPKHSRARSNGDSNSPDLAGYFLAVAGRLKPRWVVRENVPSPTVSHFDCALAALGYGTIIVRMDTAQITRQSRQRDYVIGCYQATRESVREFFSDFEDGAGSYTTKFGTEQIIPALTTHRTRYDSRDCYIYEERGLRILDSEEREAFAGFPYQWTDGYSEAQRAKWYGNSATPDISYHIGKVIIGAGA